jgi:hypothetical protein
LIFRSGQGSFYIDIEIYCPLNICLTDINLGTLVHPKEFITPVDMRSKTKGQGSNCT